MRERRARPGSPHVKEVTGPCVPGRPRSADSTVGFMGPQHPTRVYDILDDFLIGTLAETSKDK